MGAYIQIGELKTWYDEHGKGEPLVLLHGGLCPNETWAPQIPDFSERFHVLAPERQGHGRTPDLDRPLSYDAMAADTIGFLEAVVAEPAHVVGWSDGGIIGLILAISRPDLLRKLVVIGTNYDTAGLPAALQESLLSSDADAQDMAMLKQMYEASSPDGAEHWPVVFEKFKALATKEPHIPAADLGRIQARTLVVAGDDDIISPDHTIGLFRAIPNAELSIVPGASHLLTMEKPQLVNQIILDFLSNDATPTMMPIRRAGAPA
jgi:pimeloyl-ACP methyl ester carboxylesterase